MAAQRMSMLDPPGSGFGRYDAKNSDTAKSSHRHRAQPWRN